ncbi:type II toxin-antitoxin system RelE/ParE family toxin [Sphingomonas sp. M1-B02]|uniref:type II toxin-antitoxin system RelE/ParE family toxin n=1 Tax=Sphingomonas sp. M1-B02 TaxID=3114300 RepID=UPI00223F9382|nr:type II toxin-antitoxin system RelE/ParE family toxin [Sphingomonas sp. S6-11]UZK67357.1 type II toxin-antitoxin system RelE/ParE family toxin [Sphingomonas sp. S6-11]
MLPLVWLAEARADLRGISDYISDRNPAAAEQLVARIEYVAQALPKHPYLYRPGRFPGTREAVVHPNYILVYKVGDAIEILAVNHARQQYP